MARPGGPHAHASPHSRWPRTKRASPRLGVRECVQAIPPSTCRGSPRSRDALANWKSELLAETKRAPNPAPEHAEVCLTQRLVDLGVESCEGLALVDTVDLLPDSAKETGIPDWESKPILQSLPGSFAIRAGPTHARSSLKPRRCSLSQPTPRRSRRRSPPPESYRDSRIWRHLSMEAVDENHARELARRQAKLLATRFSLLGKCGFCEVPDEEVWVLERSGSQFGHARRPRSLPHQPGHPNPPNSMPRQLGGPPAFASTRDFTGARTAGQLLVGCQGVFSSVRGHADR